MAFLVCYSKGDVTDWGAKLIYLDQSFYQLLFQNCVGCAAYPLLRTIASLTYDEEIVFAEGRLGDLEAELQGILDTRKFHHPQTSALMGVLQSAQEKGFGIALAGDMHPVLTRSS